MSGSHVLARNNVTDTGTGQPMLFAHGYACDQSMWRFVVPAFRETHRIILFDHVGMGRSQRSAYDPAKYVSLEAYADDLLELCEALALRDVVFVGHSVGATIGLLAAVKQPDRFAKLVLMGPSPRYIDEGDYVGGFSRETLDQLLASLAADYVSTSSQLAPLIMGNPERPELSHELAETFCRTDAEIAHRFARMTFLSDVRPLLAEVRTPSLIVQCSHDAIAPLAVGQYVHKQIRNSKMVVMRATGHCPNLSAPVETIAAIKSFI